MDSSPKRYYASNFTSSTAQRGVEAREVEIANAHLDVNTVTTSSNLGTESSRQDGEERAPLEDAGSYLQVVVEKHRRKHERAAVAVQTVRLPSSSSPVAGDANQGGACGRGTCGAGDGEPVVWAGPVLMSRAALPAMHATELSYTCSRCAEVFWAGGERAPPYCVPRSAPHCVPHSVPRCAPHCEPDERVERAPNARLLAPGGKERLKWNFFQDLYNESLCDSGPERVEVYRFEHGSGSYLAACGGAHASRVEAAAGRGARGAAAALASLLAAPRALLALPVALLLHVQRCTLETAREAASGCVVTASDHVLKPALALTFNALVQPVLVFARNVAQAARDALRPAALALGDALEPAARLLHLHLHTHCACARAPNTP